MLSSAPSGFEAGSAYDQLARPVQRWIRKQGWPALREVQERAIPVVLGGGDVIISAATASGKSEAAFLPLISLILSRGEKVGFRAIYVSPIKALINDQHRRLESLCREAGLAVHKWHGDVAQSAKTAARRNPGGILLITPESLEATLMRRGSEATRLFGGAEAVVIDELHAFIGTERGVQLLSLLQRVESARGNRLDRIGLSATLGDMALAAEALRPGAAAQVRLIEAKAPDVRTGVEIRVKTYERDFESPADRTEREVVRAAVDRAIAEDLFATLRGKPNLVFANSRRAVEVFSDLLRETSELQGVPNEFCPHHGKLSKELRETAEIEIREARRPKTIVATSTLEMGVDIGSVERVAQIDPPSSVAALRQRVGRSGRRDGQRPSLTLYVRETASASGGPLPGQLHFPLVQGLAVCELLSRGWCEPPTGRGLHFSTLVHQILAVLTQHAGRSALALFKELCIDGPFREVTPELFMIVLRALADPGRNLIEQTTDGTLLVGRKGERRVEHFTFYAVFPTPEEYRVICNNVQLGTIEPDPGQLAVGKSIIFAGRRWDIVLVDVEAKVIKLSSVSASRTASDGVVRIRLDGSVATGATELTWGWVRTGAFRFRRRRLATSRFILRWSRSISGSASTGSRR